MSSPLDIWYLMNPWSSRITRPRWRAQSPGRLPQQQRHNQPESQHRQTQDAQAQAEPEGNALDRGECAQDSPGLLLERRSAQAAPLVVVGDACRGFGDGRTVGAEVE